MKIHEAAEEIDKSQLESNWQHCRPVSIIGKSMKHQKKSWQSIGINGNQWEAMETSEQHWKPICMHILENYGTSVRIMKYIAASIHIAFLLWVGSEVMGIRNWN